MFRFEWGGEMKPRLRILTMLAPMCLLSLPLIAQRDNHSVAFLKGWIVEGKVVTLRGDPVHGARVDVQPLDSAGGLRNTVTDLQGEFSTEYSLSDDTAREFRVELTVTMQGFLEAHEVIDFEGTFSPVQVTLREANQDPNLLTQADLISRLAPKMKDLGASDGLSVKSEKDYARGAQEFLDRKRPDRALPFFMKVVKRDVTCVACRTMLGLAELDSSDWDGASRNFEQAVGEGRKDPKQVRPEPLLALGVMESWRHEAERAAGWLAEALKYAPNDSLALQEIGRAELQLRNWATANAHLADAVAAGASPEARLLHVQALLGVAKPEEANQEMTRYLDGQDVKTMPLRVRQIWAQVQDRQTVKATYAKVDKQVERPIYDSIVTNWTDYLRRTTPELKGLESDEDQKLLEPILNAVGRNVSEFFRNFPNTSSLEAIHQEKLKGRGKGGKQDQKFQYLCVTPTQAWGPGFNEYRSTLSGDSFPSRGLTEGFMVTSGFASASLVFHPVYQSETTFRYLGRQKVNGRDAHVVAFAQHPGQSHVYGLFRDGQNEIATFVQGLAWVDSQNYQILRLRTDLIKPLPSVELWRQTTEIDFSEVHFKSIPEGFWLPQEVAVTVDWQGRVLRNDHEYSDFKVFNVDSTQKLGKPKELAETSKEGSGSQKEQ